MARVLTQRRCYMSTLRPFAAGAALIFLGPGIDTAQACSVPGFRTFANQTVDGIMTARSGKPCTIHFRSSGPTYGAAIVQRPSNGSVRVGEVNSIIYTSKPGFIGRDSFIYARQGSTSKTNPRARTVRITVTVTP